MLRPFWRWVGSISLGVYWLLRRAQVHGEPAWEGVEDDGPKLLNVDAFNPAMFDREQKADLDSAKPESYLNDH